MKTAMKKLFSLVLVAVLLVGVMPFQAFADESINVPVDIHVNGNYIRTANLSVSADMTIDESVALSMLEVPDNRSLDKWVSSTGNEFKSASLSYNWLVEYNKTGTYSLKMYLLDTTPDPEPDPEPEPEPEPVPTYNVTLKAYHGETLLDSVTCSDLTAGSTINVSEKISVEGYYIDSVEGGSNTITVVGNATYRVEMLPNAVEEPSDSENKTIYAVNIYVTKDGNDSTISRTYKEGSEITLNAALVDEVAFGSADVAWIVNGLTATNGSTITVDGPLSISCSITNKATEKKTITLNANGGRLQSYESQKYTVVIGQPYGNLPEPTREGYTFAYWYYKDKNGNEHPVDDTTKVESASTLYAKWVANGITVTFERYDMIDGWVTVESHTVPTGSKLTIEDGTFPSNSRVDLVYDIPGFDIKGWKVVETGASFKEDNTKVTSEITLRPIYKGTVKLTAQEPDTGASWKSFKVTLEIGEVIGDLKNPGSRSNYAFEGWVASNGSTEICDRFCESDIRYYPHLHGTEFFAKWEGGITVTLHIHIDGNTKTAAKIVPYYVAPAKGEFNMKTIDMYSLYDRYYHYDDSCDKIYGWYDSEEWKNYCANRAAHAATSYTDIEENEQYDFHIMLINKGDSSSSSSSSSSKADSSNPKTGDMIFNAVTIMGASAACLATLFYLNKKRAL